MIVMRRRSVAALVAALIVVAAGFLISLFFLFADSQSGEAVITLPGQGSAVIETNPQLEQSNLTQLQAVRIDRTNIQAVLASLSRPESYSLESNTVYYYRESTTTLTSRMWSADGCVRIAQQEPDGTDRQLLLTESWIYLWSGEETPARFFRQEGDEALYRRAPSYQDLLALPTDAILEGGTVQREEGLCLYARSLDELTGESEEWYVLAENGLLLEAQGTLEGRPTYQYRLTALSQEPPEDAVFLLPDGTRPMH